ncbi:MAG: carbohydrate ABC transporter permease [Chloroflexi bacterium]|nr:carbohydrate ABC transporter permease [Chloroflexota bacterium]
MIGQSSGLNQAAAAAVKPGSQVQLRIRPGSIGGYVILALLSLIYLIPLAFVFQVSLMSSRQFALNAASFPDPIMWTNYPEAWVKGSFERYFINTIVYTVSVVAGTLTFATLAAFPIARAHVRGSNGLYILFLSGILLPAGIIPQFFVMQQVGIYDTRIGYILLWWSRIALPIFILTGFIKSIPSELDDAAAIDGCPYVRYIFQIIVPLLRPALSVVGLIVAIRVWNDVIGPVIFLPSNSIKPISAGLLQFFAEFAAQWTLIAAAIAITASPLVLLYLFTQRYIIAGMTSGALKG